MKFIKSSIIHRRSFITYRLCSTQRPFYISTPIFYVNGDPHLGHAYTLVIADSIARFMRQCQYDVFFLTGTDEYGQKVEQSADNEGKTPTQFTDEKSNLFKNLTVSLNCSHNDFIRTTEDRHRNTVERIWDNLHNKNGIYFGAYEGWYAVRDEAFYSDDELVNGKAPTGADVEWVKEDSFFFRLSDWASTLQSYYKENPYFVLPSGRMSEMMNAMSLNGGLQDLSISRTSFKWGIPVPPSARAIAGSNDHVVYVWLDALSNYLSALGYLRPEDPQHGRMGQYWPADVHVIGKDILRFHAIIWPAVVLALGLQPPRTVLAHGWWTMDGEKMSKSLGNVIDPFDLLSTYGEDRLRFFLLAETPVGSDGDFTMDAFVRRVNNCLGDDIGNLVQRVLTMVKKNCNSEVPEPGVLLERDEDLLRLAETALEECKECMRTYNTHGMVEAIMRVPRAGNRYVNAEAPWVLRKTDEQRMKTVLYVMVELIRRIGVLLEPIIPNSSSKILDQVGAASDMRTFSSLAGRLAPGTLLPSPSPVFPKIEK